MYLHNMKDMFTYLNSDNVSYHFCTEKWYMEIDIQFRDLSVKFCVEQIEVFGEFTFNLKVVEPSGFNTLVTGVSFEVGGDRSLIRSIAKYLEQMAYLMHKDGKQLVTRETLVKGPAHSPVYYDSFLNILHAAGFIDTDYVEHKTTLDESTIVVFVDVSDLK